MICVIRIVVKTEKNINYYFITVVTIINTAIKKIYKK